MIIEEMVEPNRVRHYSNQNYKIRQVESGIVYDDAVDNYPCKWMYEETDIPIEPTEEEFRSITGEDYQKLIERDNDNGQNV